MLEAADHAGGAVATEELTLPGFRHDTFSAVYPAAAASPVFARWPLEEHGLRWVHPRYCYAHPLPDGNAVVLARDVGETAASLDAAAPGDGAAWAEFARPYLDHFGAWRDTLLGGFPPVAGATQAAGALGPAAALEWVRLLPDAGRRRSPRSCSGRRRARLALRRGDARRRPAARRRQRDRRGAPQRDGPRGRLAEPGGRRRAARRGARRPPRARWAA